MEEQQAVSKQKNKSNIKPLPSKSMSVDDCVIAEEIYNPKTGEVEFIRYNTLIGSIDKVKHLGSNSRPIYPYKGDAVMKGVVSLPSDALDYGDTEQLIKDITEFLHKYMDVTDEFRNICAYYILLTWVQDKLHTMPYMKLQGDKGTGKSRIQDCVGFLCYKPIRWTSGTQASLFREMNKWRGTLIFEEFVPKQSDDDDTIMQILNAGFERGRFVPRCNKDKGNKIEYFEPFGAKIFGTRKDMTSAAFESRCIKYVTTSTTRNDIPDLLPEKFYIEQAELRNKLLMWRLKNWHKIDIGIYEKINLGNDISRRIKQAYLPFVILFYNTSYMQEFKKWVKKANSEQKEIDINSYDGKIVREWVNEYLCIGYVTTSNLTERLKLTYPEMQNYFTNHAVGSHLKALGFERRSKKVGKNSPIKEVIIQHKHLKKLLNRYHETPKQVSKDLIKKYAETGLK